MLLEHLQQVVPEAPTKPVSYAEVKADRLSRLDGQRIDIVVHTHNALDDVRQCLESVERKRSAGHRLIIVDDGSDAERRDFLLSFQDGQEWVFVHRNDAPVPCTKAANIGLDLSSAPFVILLDGGTIVTDQWAEKMADAVFSTGGAGIVGPMSNAACHQSFPDHTGSAGQTPFEPLPPGLTADDMNSFCEQWASASFVPRVPLVHGFCLGVTREALERIGSFDEERFPHGFGAVNDFCMRATDAGVGLVVATHTYIYHPKSKSYSPPSRVELKAGSEALDQRHGPLRLRRCVRAMQTNPELVRLRDLASKLY